MTVTAERRAWLEQVQAAGSLEELDERSESRWGEAPAADRRHVIRRRNGRDGAA